MLDVSIRIYDKLFGNFGSTRNCKFELKSKTSDLITEQIACDDFYIDCPISATEHNTLKRQILMFYS